MKTANNTSVTPELDPITVGRMTFGAGDVLKRIRRLSGRAGNMEVLKQLHADLNALLSDTASLMSARAA